ncbi:protein kinase [Trichocoleus sp. FACHB-69]|nr:protein kinase [Trichocoleus sp. FACHB-69]
MVYCLNPNCQKPTSNSPGTRFCFSCGTLLLLKDRYRATNFLGAGGMGRNFLAVDEDTPSKKPCVIKQFFPAPEIQNNPAAFQKAIELFNREAAQLDRLGDESPQIPRLLAHIEQDKRLYFVQEFIDGQNLLQELEQEKTYNEAQIRQLLADLLPVLKFIHQQGVVHRDIKPENIMRRRNNQLVLIDFGISKELSSTVMSMGTTVGTLGYAPPEQMAYGEAYPASDLYALGATCIYLLSNVVPNELFNPQEKRWLWQDVLASRGTAVSEQLGQTLDKMLKVDVGERYQSVGEVLEVLKLKVGTNNQTNLNPSIIGTWHGKFSNKPASLIVTRRSNNVFHGTLTVNEWISKTKVDVEVDFNPLTNKIIIREIRIIPGSIGRWNLVENNEGILSLDGKQMIGKVKGYGSYSWLFSKSDHK